MIKEPKNFEDILKLQAILDSNINSKRERTLEDIKLSLIAELIEFNEETKDSHKTWKTKPYNKENEREELTDVLFFIAQLYNTFDKEDNMVKYACDVFNNAEKYITLKSLKITNIIVEFLGGYNNIALGLYLSLVNKYGYSKDDILKCYWKKWQKNMLRIGKDWN